MYQYLLKVISDIAGPPATGRIVNPNVPNPHNNAGQPVLETALSPYLNALVKESSYVKGFTLQENGIEPNIFAYNIDVFVEGLGNPFKGVVIYHDVDVVGGKKGEPYLAVVRDAAGNLKLYQASPENVAAGIDRIVIGAEITNSRVETGANGEITGAVVGVADIVPHNDGLSEAARIGTGAAERITGINYINNIDGEALSVKEIERLRVAGRLAEIPNISAYVDDVNKMLTETHSISLRHREGPLGIIDWAENGLEGLKEFLVLTKAYPRKGVSFLANATAFLSVLTPHLSMLGNQQVAPFFALLFFQYFYGSINYFNNSMRLFEKDSYESNISSGESFVQRLKLDEKTAEYFKDLFSNAALKSGKYKNFIKLIEHTKGADGKDQVNSFGENAGITVEKFADGKMTLTINYGIADENNEVWRHFIQEDVLQTAREQLTDLKSNWPKYNGGAVPAETSPEYAQYLKSPEYKAYKKSAEGKKYKSLEAIVGIMESVYKQSQIRFLLPQAGRRQRARAGFWLFDLKELGVKDGFQLAGDLAGGLGAYIHEPGKETDNRRLLQINYHLKTAELENLIKALSANGADEAAIQKIRIAYKIVSQNFYADAQGNPNYQIPVDQRATQVATDRLTFTSAPVWDVLQDIYTAAEQEFHTFMRLQSNIQNNSNNSLDDAQSRGLEIMGRDTEAWKNAMRAVLLEGGVTGELFAAVQDLKKQLANKTGLTQAGVNAAIDSAAFKDKIRGIITNYFSAGGDLNIGARVDGILKDLKQEFTIDANGKLQTNDYGVGNTLFYYVLLNGAEAGRDLRSVNIFEFFTQLADAYGRHIPMSAILAEAVAKAFPSDDYSRDQIRKALNFCYLNGNMLLDEQLYVEDGRYKGRQLCIDPRRAEDRNAKKADSAVSLEDYLMEFFFGDAVKAEDYKKHPENMYSLNRIDIKNFVNILNHKIAVQKRAEYFAELTFKLRTGDSMSQTEIDNLVTMLTERYSMEEFTARQLIDFLQTGAVRGAIETRTMAYENAFIGFDRLNNVNFMSDFAPEKKRDIYLALMAYQKWQTAKHHNKKPTAVEGLEAVDPARLRDKIERENLKQELIQAFGSAEIAEAMLSTDFFNADKTSGGIRYTFRASIEYDIRLAFCQAMQRLYHDNRVYVLEHPANVMNKEKIEKKEVKLSNQAIKIISEKPFKGEIEFVHSKDLGNGKREGQLIVAAANSKEFLDLIMNPGLTPDDRNELMRIYEEYHYLKAEYAKAKESSGDKTVPLSKGTLELIRNKYKDIVSPNDDNNDAKKVILSFTNDSYSMIALLCDPSLDNVQDAEALRKVFADYLEIAVINRTIELSKAAFAVLDAHRFNVAEMREYMDELARANPYLATLEPRLQYQHAMREMHKKIRNELVNSFGEFFVGLEQEAEMNKLVDTLMDALAEGEAFQEASTNGLLQQTNMLVLSVAQLHNKTIMNTNSALGEMTRTSRDEVNSLLNNRPEKVIETSEGKTEPNPQREIFDMFYNLLKSFGGKKLTGLATGAYWTVPFDIAAKGLAGDVYRAMNDEKRHAGFGVNQGVRAASDFGEYVAETALGGQEGHNMVDIKGNGDRPIAIFSLDNIVGASNIHPVLLDLTSQKFMQNGKVRSISDMHTQGFISNEAWDMQQEYEVLHDRFLELTNESLGRFLTAAEEREYLDLEAKFDSGKIFADAAKQQKYEDFLILAGAAGKDWKELNGHETRVLNDCAAQYLRKIFEAAGLPSAAEGHWSEYDLQKIIDSAKDLLAAENDFRTALDELLATPEIGLNRDTAMVAVDMLYKTFLEEGNDNKALKVAGSKDDLGKLQSAGFIAIDPRLFITKYHELQNGKGHSIKGTDKDQPDLNYLTSNTLGDYIFAAADQAVNSGWQTEAREATGEPETMFWLDRPAVSMDSTLKPDTLTMAFTGRTPFENMQKLIKTVIQYWRERNGAYDLKTTWKRYKEEMMYDTISATFQNMWYRGNLYPFLPVLDQVFAEMDKLDIKNAQGQTVKMFSQNNLRELFDLDNNGTYNYNHELDMQRNGNKKLDEIFKQVMEKILDKNNPNPLFVVGSREWQTLVLTNAAEVTIREKIDAVVQGTLDKDFKTYLFYLEGVYNLWKPRLDGTLVNVNSILAQAEQEMMYTLFNSLQLGGHVDMQMFNYIAAYVQGQMGWEQDQGCSNFHLLKWDAYFHMTRMALEFAAAPANTPPNLRTKFMVETLPYLSSTGIMMGLALVLSALNAPMLLSAGALPVALHQMLTKFVPRFQDWIRAKAKTTELSVNAFYPSVLRWTLDLVKKYSAVEDARSQTEQIKCYDAYGRHIFTIPGGAIAEGDWAVAYGQMFRWFGADTELRVVEGIDGKRYELQIKSKRLSNAIYRRYVQHYKEAEQHVQFPLSTNYNLRFPTLMMTTPLVGMSMFNFKSSFLSNGLGGVFGALGVSPESSQQFGSYGAIGLVSALALVHYYGIQNQIKQTYASSGVTERAAQMAEDRANLNDGKMIDTRLENVLVSFSKAAFNTTEPLAIPEYKSFDEFYLNRAENDLAKLKAAVSALNLMTDNTGHIAAREELFGHKLSRIRHWWKLHAPNGAFNVSVGLPIATAIGLGIQHFAYGTEPLMIPLLAAGFAVPWFAKLSQKKLFLSPKSYMNEHGLVGVAGKKKYEGTIE
ncbi:hypothetical protein NO1_0359 [Candidatus Termititenax aidoneus]|uniref:Uncharacterized protein n=1 Tax=Termititenax aidoneus TaxID=2218524 RepID=A0A388T8N8_TERA1|nr:hypothetical protein NO1_0359 [Candidatus Termititenax aidoneus]